MNKSDKKIMLSGIQPTGTFTLGNYIGAISNWKKIQDEFNCIYFIANLHSLTVMRDARKLSENTLDAVALLLACGIDPKKSVIFVQSMVPEHTQLSWILQCFTQFGELSRMTQFKDKSAKNSKNINAGLFGYPALMAADILLYQADYVPVGEDQTQHVELTRVVANRFNGIYGDIFKIPNPYIPKNGARVMSLTDPGLKMSKSDSNANSYISLLDDEDTIIKKFKRAVTDSNSVISYERGSDGVRNLLSVYSALTNKDFTTIEDEFKGRGYGDLKAEVGKTVADTLKPVKEQFEAYSKDKQYLTDLLNENAQKVSVLAQTTLTKVYDAIGLLK